MTKTNSYQRAKLRVTELEEENEALKARVTRLKNHIDGLEKDSQRFIQRLENAKINYDYARQSLSNAEKESQELLFETIDLKKQILSQRNTTTAFVILSLFLTVGIIILISIS